MTAKERLRDLVETVSEAEAERMLERCESVVQNGHSHPNGVKNEQPTDIDSLFAFFDETVKNAPEDDARRVPTDLAENLDHYIYGTPKRNPTA